MVGLQRPRQRAAAAEGRWRRRQRGLRPRTGGPGNARSLDAAGPSFWNPTGNTISGSCGEPRTEPRPRRTAGGDRPTQVPSALGARAPVDHTHRVVAPPRRRGSAWVGMRGQPVRLPPSRPARVRGAAAGWMPSTSTVPPGRVVVPRADWTRPLSTPCCNGASDSSSRPNARD